MHIRITYNDTRGSIDLHSVRIIERIFQGLEITCYGNLPVRHMNVLAIEIIDWI